MVDNNEGQQQAKKKKQSRKAPPGDYITKEKFDEIMSREDDPVFRMLYRFLWFLAMRIEEALSRKVSDLVLEGENKGILVSRTKNDSFDVFPIPSKFREDLTAYVKECGLSGQDYLFPARYGRGKKARSLDRSTVNKRLKMYGKVLSAIKYIHPHALRRGFGIWYLDQGHTINEVQHIYGHDSMLTTIRYLGLDKRKTLKGYSDFMESAYS